MNSKAAIVVVTAHDGPTKRISKASVRIPNLLEKSGKSKIVLQYRDTKAKKVRLHDVYVGMTELRRKAEFVFGFFAAHGSERGLHGANWELLLELQTCKQFRDAVLVLCSCLKTGRFPDEVVKLRAGTRLCVRSVIGYREKMRVPGSTFIEKLDPRFSDALQEMIEAHVLPLLQNKSVEQAIKEIKAKLYEILTRNCLSQESRLVISFNIPRLQSWGDRKARLPLVCER